jgi:hypothetical protein
MDETGRMGGNTIRLDRAERLAGRLHGALRDGKVIKATLGGAIIALSAGGMLAILPEPPRARGRKPSNLVHATV